MHHLHILTDAFGNNTMINDRGSNCVSNFYRTENKKPTYYFSFIKTAIKIETAVVYYKMYIVYRNVWSHVIIINICFYDIYHRGFAQ